MNFARKLTSLSALAFMAATSAACGIGASDESVGADVELINHTKSALSAAGLSEISGTYDTCQGHTDGDPWSARIFGSAPLLHPALSVTKDDINCHLRLDALIDGDGTTDYAADPWIALGTSYGDASAFSHASTLKFYGVAKMSSTSFHGNFTMTVLISDSPNLATNSGKEGSFAQVSSTSVSSTNVAPSDYSVDTSNFTLQVNVANVVDSTGGSVGLSGTIQGDAYAIASSDPGSTFAAVDTFWGSATPTAILDANPSIGASEFTLEGEDLDSAPGYRWVVVRRADNGVPSYQVIRFEFDKPGGYN